jgi:predicted LPLAT superfamily acyltransferase
MRLDTNFVELSSRDFTIAPSVLLFINSNKPGRPVTATNLLYSIVCYYYLPHQAFAQAGLQFTAKKTNRYLAKQIPVFNSQGMEFKTI